VKTNVGKRWTVVATMRHVLFAAALLSGASPTSQAQDAIDGFDPDANDAVQAFAVQADGKILVGGDFTVLGGQSRGRIARLTPDGDLDPAFLVTSIDDTVKTIVTQADGRIIVAGAFTQVGPSVRNRIIRLNADGTLDGAFNPNANGEVSAVVVQPDGKLVVAVASPRSADRRATASLA
jgi:uncharacterized delta-60 repeat protein